MAVAKFSKQGIQPDPREVDYWIDISTDPYGSVIKYFNGAEWVDLVADGETGMSPFDYYTKVQINDMINRKADVGSVDSKVDDAEIENLIKDVEIKEVGDSAVQLIILRHNNTKIGTTVPIATNTTPGIVTASDFANFVKQHQLQHLYSEMYDLLADIREKYQPRLKAGKNIQIDRTTNTISATGSVSIDWDKITNAPDIPTKTSQLVNDSGFITSNELGNAKTELNKRIDSVDAKTNANTSSIKNIEQQIPQQISEAISEIVDGANSDFDTLKEIADYIASDKTGAAQMSNSIASNKKAIDDEVARATTVENQLLQRVENIEQGSSVDYVTEQVLNEAVQSLTSSDADLLSKINTETNERKSAVSAVSEIANAAATKVALETEVERATDAETKLNNEVNSLKNTTSTLTNNLSAETSRATAAEETLQTNIEDAVTNINTTLTDKYYTGSVVDIKIDDAISTHNEDELAHEPIRNSVTLANSVANEAKTLSSDAVNTAYEFAQVAQDAKTTADAAKNAISSLEGLTDVDTSALTTAEIISKVEQNVQDIKALKERDVILSQSSFDDIAQKDVTKHYFIYENPV